MAVNFIKRLLQYFEILVESSVYITIRETQLKTKTGRLSGIKVPDGMSLECNNFVWDRGDLEGYQKILSSTYAELFVKHDDVTLFQENPPEEVAYVILYETDGSTRRFDEV